MSPRPTSVTVVSVILIILGALGLLSPLALIAQRDNPQVQEAMALNPLPPAAQLTISVVGALVTLVSGIAVLRGQNWARWLFTGWFVLGFAVGLVVSPMKLMLIPGVIINLVLIFLLFRPAANAYFASGGAAPDA